MELLCCVWLQRSARPDGTARTPVTNGTGKFLVSGPQCDTRLTGRKIVVDTYGGWTVHG